MTSSLSFPVLSPLPCRCDICTHLRALKRPQQAKKVMVGVTKEMPLVCILPSCIPVKYSTWYNSLVRMLTSCFSFSHCTCYMYNLQTSTCSMHIVHGITSLHPHIMQPVSTAWHQNKEIMQYRAEYGTISDLARELIGVGHREAF